MESKILIVENEILIANHIAKMLVKEKFNLVELAHDQKTAEDKFKTYRPDIILMDINLDGPDTGIQLASKRNQEAKVIFLTAQNDPETIAKALATQPESYLTKPIKKSDVLAALQIAIAKTSSPFYLLKDGNKIYHKDILYIKADNNYIDIITAQHKYSLRSSLDHFLEELNNPIFCKTHRSYIINKEKMSKKTKKSVFIEGVEIPISRNSDFSL